MALKDQIMIGIRKFFSAENLEKDNLYAPDKYVAAGDPVKAEWPDDSSLQNPADEAPSGKRRQFIVAGNSMLPKGVKSGDSLCGTPFDQKNQIETGDFLIIKVDKSIYGEQGNRVKYKYKLRCAISEIAPGADFNTLYENVSGKEDSVLLDNNKRELEEKYSRAVANYPETTLVVSLTFKEGKIHYSFHPKNLVEFVGVKEID